MNPQKKKKKRRWESISAMTRKDAARVWGGRRRQERREHLHLIQMWVQLWCDAILCAPTVGQGMFRGYITLDFRGTQLLLPSISRSLSRSVCLGWVHWSRAGTDGRQRSTHGPHRWAGRGGCRRVKVTERAGADVNMIQRMDKLW